MSRSGGISVPVVAPPHGSLVLATTANRASLSRHAKAGSALRLARGLYALGATLPAEQVARHHLHACIAAYWPDSVLCARTALAGGVPVDGELFVAHPNPRRSTPLELPGVTVRPVVGPPALPGDMPMPGGLSMSGPVRALIENIDVVGRPARLRAGTRRVEDRIDELARTGGAGRVASLLQSLDVIGHAFDPAAVAAVRQRLLAVLGSVTDGLAPKSPTFQARLGGTPYDAHRIEMLRSVVGLLTERSPEARFAAPPAGRWEWLPFFEAYFSNFIEGTEFGVEEARAIAVSGVVSESRPQDAHDVAATYRLATDPVDRIRVPRSGEELVAILQDRHRVLMAAREDKRPGELKRQPNYAGGYQFVDPSLVPGTLVHGFSVLDPLIDPFARAVAMMVLITEVHPFDDGNGRVARLNVNAELSAAGQVRTIVPTVFRTNYLKALSGLSNGSGRGEALVAVLSYAQRWAAALDWSSFEFADEQLRRCNAYVDPIHADDTGVRLTMP
jgi:hypothetical protein